MAQYLRKAKSGGYYFRIRIPKNLIPVNGAREIQVALQTDDIFEAEKKSSRIKSFLKELFVYLSTNKLTFERKRIYSSGDFMHDLIASIRIGNADVKISASAEHHQEFAQLINSITNTQTVQQKPNKKPSNHLLCSEIYERYVNDPTIKGKPGTVQGRRSAQKYFNRLFDGLYMDEIDEAKSLEIRQTLPRLPSAYRHPDWYDNKGTFEEAERMTKITAKSVFGNFQRIKAFFTWSRNQGYCAANPFSGIRMGDPDTTNIMPYTQAELQTLFCSKFFFEYCKYRPYRYWINLIALYSGMRLREIAQLETEDIIFSKSGQGFMRVCLDSHVAGHVKQIKNKNSVRMVPIHGKLMELGFKNYLESVRSTGLLFPDITLKKGVTQSNGVTCAFMELRTKALPNLSTKKTFHSLRHNVITCLQHKNVPLPLIQQLVGHAFGTITLDVYGEPFDPSDLVSTVNKIDYGLKHPTWAEVIKQ